MLRIVRCQCHGEVALNVDWLRFGLVIRNRFSAIMLYCDSTQLCPEGLSIKKKRGQKDIFKLPSSGEKRNPNPNFLVRWGGGLPHERVGAKKFGMSIETQGNQTSLAGHPGFLPGYPGSARKV